MSVINTQPLAGASGNQVTGYNLTKSLRLRASASAYLSRTPSSSTNGTKWTYSTWVKRSSIGSNGNLLMAYTGSSNRSFISFSGDILIIYQYTGGSYPLNLQTNAVYRDPSAWYHIVVSYDTTQATASNRVLLYVNGVQVTSFGTSTYPSLNLVTDFNTATPHAIGADIYNNASYLDGYLTETNFIDGQALSATSFGETDSTTGVWKPKAYTGTYGTNGFYLPFTDVATTSGSNAGLGKDFSGNGNYWTTNNISVTAGSTYDSMTDVPTLTSATAANYCVLNPLQNSIYSLTAGNLSIYGGGNSSYCPSTMQIPPTGKFYWEFKCTDTQTTLFRDAVGLVRAGQPQEYLGASTNSVSYCGFDGNMRGAISTGVYSTWTNGDVVGIAVDGATGKVWFSKNNVWQNSGNPSADTGQVGTISNVSEWMPAFGAVAGGSTYYISGNVNFGQQPFAYTPPTGFVALNTYNLPDSTIVAGNTVMDATTYTGNGGTLAVTNAGLIKPDFVWIKQRGGATSHVLQDSIRGAGKSLFSNATNAESGNAGDLVASFNSNGFTVNDTYLGGSGGGGTNGTSSTYVGWQWQAGQGTTSSNTSGSITSTVSVNASAGFSIVTFTTPASGAFTVGHGLGVAPSMYIFKRRGNTSSWGVWHTSLSSGTSYLLLDSTSAQASDSTVFSASPTSTVLNIGSAWSASGATTSVAYCWSEIAGFSKFGSYTGNGSTDGTFVYTGFRPRYVLIKRTDNVSDWWVLDSARDTYNVVAQSMYANSSAAEFTETDLDFLSNGFKLRKTASPNSSGGTFIYAAFAENPFKNSLAR